MIPATPSSRNRKLHEESDRDDRSEQRDYPGKLSRRRFNEPLYTVLIPKLTSSSEDVLCVSLSLGSRPLEA